MVGTGAGTCADALAGEVGELGALPAVGSGGLGVTGFVALAWVGADVAGVVGVGPHAARDERERVAKRERGSREQLVRQVGENSLGRRAVPRPPEVSHRPHAGPQTGDVPRIRERDRHLDVPRREAELVPAREHPYSQGQFHWR